MAGKITNFIRETQLYLSIILTIFGIIILSILLPLYDVIGQIGSAY